LHQSRLGIDSLKLFLQELLDRHIEKELPKVRREIKALLTLTEGNLAKLGDERPTVNHIRMFLTRLSMKFHSLTQAALDGNYNWTDDNFFTTSDGDRSSTRLRAELHSLNGNFSTYVRDKGQKMRLCSDPEPDILSELDVDSESNDDSEEEEETVCLTKQEFEAWIKRVQMNSRRNT